MKIIHTSDWHLGQYFLGKSRQNEHKRFLQWLRISAIEKKVDAIIVAGDIFDTGSPPSYARELYNQFIEDLQKTGIKLIIVGGNHDSVATLGESKGLLKLLNTIVIPGVMKNLDDHVITLTDKNKQPVAMICAIPYLRARDLQFSQAGLSGKQKQASLQQAISKYYLKIYDLAIAQRKAIEDKIPIIATGHLATVGAKTSDSVRDIYIGTLESYSSNNFPPADYIALGHIHRSQKVGKSEHIRYCGSPITLSFDELNTDKKVLVVEFDKDKLKNIEEIKVPCFQQLKLIKGNLAEIEKQLTELDGNIWLDIEVSSESYLGDLHQRIQIMLEGKSLEVLKLRRSKPQKLKSISQTQKETLQELTPVDVLNQRLDEEDWSSKEQKVIKKQVIKAFNQVLEQLHENT